MRIELSLVLTVTLALAGTARAQSEDPLSAIDWLSESVREDIQVPRGHDGAVVQSAAPPAVSVTPLDTPRLDSVGLLPGSTTGLPADLWGDTGAVEIARLIRATPSETLPAVQDLFYMLLLAELDPPEKGAADDGVILLARLDKLLEMGALEQARALLERTDPAQPALFRRWFDISLLTGHEDRACRAMRATPDLAPTFPARIFCLARGNDWNAAALSLETGRALNHITEYQDALLARFLHPELAEDQPPLPAPSRPSPLVFRLLEAIGEPLPTNSLPVAFAQADLRHNGGWKARIDAAERLARRGAISPNQLLGIYTEALPAASGGVWDRVAAVQKLDVALISGDTDAVQRALPAAWSEMRAAGLVVPLSRLYGPRLARLALGGTAKSMAFRAGLLSDDYEAIASTHGPLSRDETLLRMIATGQPGPDPMRQPLPAAVQQAFADATLGENMRYRLEHREIGEAILMALQLIADGAEGDPTDVTEGLVLLRQVGLEDAARRIALQLLILGRDT
ncbi:hypothetical protein [Actibacterium ureilyticum]|uniref:hypothetical protein n=1 Tax=Actibacterium ureilyticum TaxID=1590614 RepID=UPI000BAADEF5|nr:hypothetical protein [Actibacterium ureilyticum]